MSATNKASVITTCSQSGIPPGPYQPMFSVTITANVNKAVKKNALKKGDAALALTAFGLKTKAAQDEQQPNDEEAEKDGCLPRQVTEDRRRLLSGHVADRRVHRRIHCCCH